MSRRPALLLPLLLSCAKPAAPPVAAEAPPPPTASLDGDLAELHAFAELVGLVRYFHPSDEAARTPWDLFVLHGAKRLLDEPGFQLDTLQGLFAPIAPTVQVARGAAPPPVALPEAGDRVVAWGHKSVGIYSAQAWGAHSVRSGRPLTQTDWPASRRGMSHKPTHPSPLPGRWRLTLDISGDPSAQVQAQVWEVGAEGRRISRQSQAARAVSRTHPSRLVLEHDSAGQVERLNVRLFMEALEDVTVHHISLAWQDAAGVWGEPQPMPLVLGDDAATAWTSGSRSGMDCGTEDRGLVCRRKVLPEADREPPVEISTPLGDAWQGPIGADLHATVPLALPADEAHSFPRGHAPDAEARWLQELALHQGDDRTDPALRVASVIQAWTVVRHFHPHPESLRGTWGDMLDEALADAVAGERSLRAVLGRMLAHLPDGQIDLVDDQRVWMRFPLKLVEVDGRVFVLDSAHPGIQAGDELIAVDGEPVRVRLDRLHAVQPGTDQWRRLWVRQEVRTAEGEQLTLTIERDGVEQTRTLHFDEGEGALSAGPALEALGDGRYLLDSTQEFGDPVEVATTLPGSAGAAIDLRGYPRADLLAHLVAPGTALSPDWASWPVRTRPDTVAAWDGRGFARESTPPFLDLPMVWITHGGAISYSESVLGWAHSLDPDAHFVGPTPTAGANGINHRFPLLGGFGMGWTSMRATHIDGTGYFGEGIGVHELATWTPTAVAAGRDPVRDAALAWLRGDRVPAPFLGMWVGDDGTELLVTREAVYWLDATRWRARWPVLAWSEAGPTVCARGVPRTDVVAQAEGGLRLTLPTGAVVLAPQASGPKAGGAQSALVARLQARVLPEPPPPVSAEAAAALAAELARRAAADQEARTGPQGDPRAVDADNRRWLREQVDAVGWIDPERFGLAATKDAWLLVQHSGDLGLMLAVAPRLRGVEGLAEEWALTVDRVASWLGEPQRFGTQARGMPDGALAVLPVTDAERVRQQRAALGLPSWSSYLADFEAGDRLPLLDCTAAPSETVPAKPVD